ncbi:TonB-dependent receptor [Runella sp. MFBS21]|uniref:SusC/RagA family TonB-linked outer membrane protein n=1 Tax=Runella sp. MFBS21 TaxID=3034018 RepID=UPI0023F88706|nr:TonB-dependent receptor [Runella sp. MFBS21]MDF7819349.1 TonB-dependent receptor [Runella sp. MFBS21]
MKNKALPLCRRLVRVVLIFAVVFVRFCLAVTAQTTGTISGKILDEKGGEMPGVNVLLKGTSVGTTSDAQGRFSLKISNADVLVVSFIGYKTQEVKIGGRTQLDVEMQPDISTLSEVLVVGYGTQSRETVTTSISKVDTKVLQNAPYTNVGAALQGAVPGLRVQTTSGEPGAASRIILRGGTSINNPNGASPLYIVDGVIRDAGFTDLNPNDIETMQVLKDAAATAIYGARGSNGVILITTKSGKSGKTVVNYSYAFTNSQPGRRTEYASAHDYIYYNRLGTVAAANKNAALAARNQQANGSGTGNDLSNNTAYTVMYLSPDNQHKLNEGWTSMPDPVDPSKTIIYKETNYSDLIYQNSMTHQHNISASGSTEKASFNAAMGYITGAGTVVATDYKRLNLNLNGNLNIKKNLSIGARMLFSNRKNNPVSNYSYMFYRYPSLPGTAKYQFEDGTMAPGQSRTIGNPDYFLRGPYAPKGDNNLSNLTVSLNGRWEILPNFTFEPQLSLLKVDADAYTFQPAALLNGVGAVVTTRSASASYSKTMQYQAEGVFTYAKSFGEHNIEAKAGYSYYSRNLLTQSAAGEGAATDNIPTLNAAATPTSVAGSVSDLRIEGVFARLNYDYKQRYLLSLNIRHDGASNLGSQNRFGTFPGISAGWNLHKEAFWSQLIPENLLELKLRASYGVNGNISGLGDFQAMGNYAVGSRYSNGAAVIPSVLPNADLKWEKSKTVDVGFDAALFKQRVSIMFDYYNRTTSDLLTTVSLPVSSGYSSVFTNLGTLQNKGIEAAINVRVLPPTSQLQWDLSVNAAKVNTKILKLPDNGVDKNRIGGVYVWDPAIGAYNWLGGLQEGGRVGDMYAYELIGVYKTDEEAAKAPADQLVNTANKTKYGGDAIWRDVDGNNIIDTRDQVYVGNPYPKWTGGLSSSLSYKQLSFYVRMDYSLGATIYNYPAVFADGQLQGDALPTQRYIDNMWKKPGDVTNTPRYVWQNQFNNIRPNNTYYEKGDFLAIREVTLAYVLPSRIVNKLKMSNIRLNFTGSNLHYFTRYSGQNPDDGGQDNGHFPMPVNFTVGANVTF